MVPVNLSIKNFLSYGPEIQTISFEPYHFICLSGKNGHGKSALLDALTWATWGQARKSSGVGKNEDQLLHIAETEMMVVFEFVSEQKQYRIKRTFTKQGAKGISSLDFGIMRENNHIVSLTGKTIRETQQAIIKEIGLDFETFLNSSFLRQGDANEFSKKTPKERKDILGKILSLDYYELIKKNAYEKIKELTTSKELTLAQQKSLLETQEGLHDLEQKIIVNQEKRTNNDQSTEKLQQQFSSTTTLHTQASKEAWGIEKIKELEQKQLQEQKKYCDSLQSLRSERRHIRSEQRKQPALSLLQTQKETLLAHIFTQQQLLEKKIEYEKELLTLQQALIETSKKHEQENKSRQEPLLQGCSTITAEKRALLSQLDQLKKETEKLSSLIQNSEQQIEIYTHELNKQEEQEKIEYFFVKRMQKRSLIYQQLMPAYKETEKVLHELLLQMKLLEQESGSCPLCLSQLLPNTKLTAKKNLEKKQEEIAYKQLRIRTCAIRIKEYLEKESHRKTEYDSILKQKDEQKKLLLHTISTKEHLLASLTKQQVSLTTLQEKHQKLESQEKVVTQQIQNSHIPLEQNKKYRELSDKVHALQTSRDNCPYNPSLHKTYRQELDKLCLLIASIEEQQYERKVAQINEKIRQRCAQLRDLKKQLQNSDYQQEKYESLQKKILVLETTLQSIKTALQKLSDEKNLLLQEQGQLLSQNKQKTELVKTVEENESILKNLQRDIDQYSMIVSMTGKDGIQALLVEQAIPEIEYEANAILSRLSKNEMHIFIESLKDLKSGKTKETLDITISDTKGIRPYELFSGGEAFRIDLSLRIALSKLLAHRAGTTIETLIIDEGFGSQDDEGVSLIIDALYKIQSDFKKIIIVSHLPYLKEQVPVHFSITKLPQGSTVSVMTP